MALVTWKVLNYNKILKKSIFQEEKQVEPFA
jgi:hypothetical protein